MNKFLLAIAAGVAVVSVGFAESNSTSWFKGFSDPVAGGAWSDPLPEGASKEGNIYILDGVETNTPLTFTAANAKAADVYTNLIFTTSANFQSAYPADDMPAIPSDAKAGVIAVEYDEPASVNYCVIRKKSGAAANEWCKTETTITDVENETNDVVITITKSGDVYSASYKIGSTEITNVEVYVAANSFSGFSYAGSGAITNLIGEFKENFIPPSGVPEIPAEKQDDLEKWAKDNGIAVNEFGSTTTLDNGLTAYQSFALGVNTNETVCVTNCDNGVNSLAFAINSEPNMTIQYKINNGAASDTAVVALSDLTGRGTYAVKAYISDGKTSTEVNLGTQGVDPVAVEAADAGKVQYIGVAFTDSEASNVAIENIFKKSELVEGDQIDVFKPEDAKWETWSWNGTEWELAGGGSAAVPKLAPGAAIKFTPKADGKRYLIGDYDTSKITSTAVVENKFNFLANPKGEATALSKFDQTEKMRLMPTNMVLPNMTYRYISKSKSWYAIPQSSTNSSARSTAVTTLPAGGFFLEAKSPTVNW